MPTASEAAQPLLQGQHTPAPTGAPPGIPGMSLEQLQQVGAGGMFVGDGETVAGSTVCAVLAPWCWVSGPNAGLARQRYWVWTGRIWGTPK